MIDKKPIFVVEMKWKNDIYALELYNSINFSGLKSVTQVQAVCFTDDNDVVLYQHSDNYLGLPGGTPEEGESFEETLKRELYEEISVEVLDFGPIGYIKVYKKDRPEKFDFQLRYWAKVKLLEETPDPDNKAIGRVLTPINKAVEKLNWGKRGELLIELAKNKGGFVN